MIFAPHLARSFQTFARAAAALAIVAQPGVVGILARRLLSTAVIVPVVVGWLAWRGAEAGLYGDWFAVALPVLVTIFMFGVLTIWTIRFLDEVQTQRRLEEAAVLEGQGRLSGIVNSAMDAIITIDEAQCIALFNPAAERMFGYSADEILGRPLAQLMPERFRTGHAAHIRMFGERGVTSRKMGALGAISGLRAGGDEFPIEASISQLEVGGQKLYTVILRDITERQRVDNELREGQERLRGIVDSAMDAIITVDEAQRVTLFNPAAEVMFGYTASEMLGQPLTRLMPERFRAGHAAHIRMFGERGVTSRRMGALGAISGLRASGEEFPIEASISQLEIDGRKLYTVILRDITERRLAEAALREASEFSAQVITGAGEGIAVFDRDLRYQVFNPYMEELSSWPASTVLGRTVEEVMPNRQGQEGAARLRRALDGEVIHSGDMLMPATPTNPARWITSKSSPLRNAKGDAVGVITIVNDIHERKRIEEALREAGEFSAQVISGASEGIAVLDNDLCYKVFNPIMEGLFGWQAAAVLGRRVDEVLPAPLGEQAAARMRRALQGEVVFSGDLFLPATTAGMPPRWITSKASPLLDVAGNITGVIVVVTNITERKQAEAAVREKHEELQGMSQQLWQATKLATLGELASSIAHEINNPLATVSLRVEDLLDSIPADDANRRSLEIIGQESERMGTLVNSLLQFSRRSARQTSTLDVRQEIEGTLELVYFHLRNHKIELNREFQAEVPYVMADRQQLRQLLLNLFTNASDAMPQGGTLTLRVRHEAPLVVMEVGDTGNGIAPELLTKVLEPFFTTKPEGKGTGLGLAICRRIAEEHGGTLEISSVLGQGTVIRIAFPVAQNKNTDAEAARELLR